MHILGILKLFNSMIFSIINFVSSYLHIYWILSGRLRVPFAAVTGILLFAIACRSDLWCI
jgi:hypothetical protein